MDAVGNDERSVSITGVTAASPSRMVVIVCLPCRLALFSEPSETSPRSRPPRAARPDRLGELVQHRHGHVPAETRVGDALAVARRHPGLQLLPSFLEEALH